MRACEDHAEFVTARLRLRPPRHEDAAEIHARYASVAEVVRYVGWARHTCLEDTYRFVRYSLAEWQRWPLGPLLIEDRYSGELIGATGVSYETPDCASTGYALAQERWGLGYASEALEAVTQLTQQRALPRLYALCHAEHQASRRVLERNRFALETVMKRSQVFPNLGSPQPQDICRYVWGGVVPAALAATH